MLSRLSILVVLAVHNLFSDPVFAAPTASPAYDLFSDPDIPVLDSFDLSAFIPADHGSKKGKRAVTINYVVYNITIDGRNQGNWDEWVVPGGLLIIDGIPSPGTQNGPNPLDVVILSGSPVVNPIAGSIRYFTNRLFYQLVGGTYANSLLDFAFVTSTSNSVTVTVDSSLAAANQLSNFNARSGLLANVYLIYQGGFSLTWTTTTVSGPINLIGNDYVSVGTAPYKGLIKGTVYGRGSGTI